MGKKDLKKQSTVFGEDFINMLSKIDPSGTNKFLPFMLKMTTERANKYLYDEYRGNVKIDNWYENTLFDICTDAIGGYRNIELLEDFNNHLKNKRIEKVDLSQYKSWDDLVEQKNIADFKMMDKNIAKEVIRVHEDSEWLVIKPLSFKASLVYGSNTKWCTASKNDPDYFYRYSKNGILLYVLNKLNGKKYGFYSNEEEFSIWNQTDYRIDSLETSIPYELLLLIKEECEINKHPNNVFYFSEKEKEYYSEKSLKTVLTPIRYGGDVEPDAIFEEPILYGEAEIGLMRTSYFDLISNDDDVVQAG